MTLSAVPPRSVPLRILLVDDERIVDRSLGDFLRDRGHEVTYCDSARKALEAFRREEFAVVITDIRMPGLDGIGLLEQIREIAPDAAVIIITGHGDLDAAVAALRAGAADFLQKPLDLRMVTLALERVSRLRELRRLHDSLAAELRQTGGVRPSADAMVGRSASIRRAREAVESLRGKDWTSIHLAGESGTGKELVARLLHAGTGAPDAPFIAVNCAAISPSLAEAEIFGHERGAFTGAARARKGLVELADQGMLFLDEIGDMPLEMQSRLLRVLEEKAVRRVGGERTIPVRFRLISATNRDLESLSASGAFRKDLYFRINVISMFLPPLRERPDDIEPLAELFLRELRQRLRRPELRLSEDALLLMREHSFPGNVRELRNLLEQAALLCAEDPLPAEAFPSLGSSQGVAGSPIATLGIQEAEAVRRALELTGGNVREAAALLGIGYGALRYRLKRMP